ncbi:hypothetical protein F4802DRAFT_571075 [Xylaria palmicola]|nr:hypothetical protein F4802DRAFT_571075 [Xylaria palmicola]
MSSMSRNNSANSLMGFSVHQPSIGAALQFFPAMGSTQLDEMIDAYVPGNASILDKRTVVTMEFFQYSMATGESFKFFMVYSALPSANTSPAIDSGYHSSFTTSPVLSESQWAGASNQAVSPSSPRRTTSPNDFSHLPGMKIMTKDGRDVTNSASRGCKTKEQRDHAHLMRIIKACDSCRRKKTKCDPSHKRTAAGTPAAKVIKRTSKTPRPAAAPPQIATEEAPPTLDFDQILSESSSSFDSLLAESLNAPLDAFSMEWDQFIQYDQEPAESTPYDYNFFLDPTSFFSPALTESFSSSSTSPSQLPITPTDRDVHIADDIISGHDHKPILPYLNPGGVEAGSNYVDFNLYSPQSSFLDDELDVAKEVAASPIQSQRLDHHRHKHTGASQGAVASPAVFEFYESTDQYQQPVISDLGGDGFFLDTSSYLYRQSGSTIVDSALIQDGALGLQHASQIVPSHEAVNNTPATLGAVDNVQECVTSAGLYGREAIYNQTQSWSQLSRHRSRSSLAPNTTEDAFAGPQNPQVVAPESLGCNSCGNSGATRIQSASPQTHEDKSCGQDGPNGAEHSMTASTTKSSLATESRPEARRSIQGGSHDPSRLEFKESQHDVPSVQRFVIPQAFLYRVPSTQVPSSTSSTTSSAPSPSLSPTPSWMPSPSPLAVIPPNSWGVGSSTSEQLSQTIFGTPTISGGAIPMNRPLVTSTARHSLVEQHREVALSWNSESESRDSARVTRGLAAMPNELLLSGTQPSPSVIAGLSALSVMISLASLRNISTKGCGRVVDPRSAVVSMIGRCAIALLLFSLSLSSPHIFILSISVLPIIVYVRSQQRVSPSTRLPSSDTSSWQPITLASQLVSTTCDNLKASYGRVVRMTQCGLANKLHPQIPSTTGSPTPEPQPKAEGRAVMRLI